MGRHGMVRKCERGIETKVSVIMRCPYSRLQRSLYRLMQPHDPLPITCMAGTIST